MAAPKPRRCWTGWRSLPRRQIDYDGRVLEEMDLDALLARRPALALVDELAHTNAPGSRHPKRYLDVEELLAAGIDVYPTLNIQHVESLNDVVARITRIRVRETVPDGVLDQADEIEVIDLTPDDLMQRLREGKVYVPQTAARALDHYFSPGNLTALRELALRRTAQRVDAQMLDHMQAHAISGPWAAGERVLVCVAGSGAGAALVRYGRRVAERLRAPWTALHVEPPRRSGPAEAADDRVADALRLAERLGGRGGDHPRPRRAGRDPGLCARAQFHPYRGRQPRRRGALVRAAARQRGAGADRARRRHPGACDRRRQPRPPPTPPRRGRGHGRDPAPYLASTRLRGRRACWSGMGLQQMLAVSSISLVFLTAVLASAAAFGLWPSLYACLLSVLAYNFFFLPPIYTFTIADPENVVALFFFLVAALIASNLAAGMRAQALAARLRARTTEELYQFSRKLAGTVSWTTCSGPPPIRSPRC